MKKESNYAKDKKPNIRAYALDIIINVMEKGQYSDKALHAVLDSGVIPDKRDRAFISRLCDGTVERAVTLDYIINCFSNVKVHKMKPVIRNIIRMAVYQIFYMDQVPESAACNEAVNLAVMRGFAGLRGFVNGVTRSIMRGKDTIQYPQYKDGFIRYASVKYSMPEWIVEKYCAVYGEETTEAVLNAYLSGQKHTTVRCNISKADVSGITGLLKRDGVSVQEGSFFPYALKISGYDSLASLGVFRDGLVQVQDESSMLVAAVSRIKENNTIIDICAAPGGKTMHAADILNGTGKVISCDISKSKTELIRENVKRTGFGNICVYENDALLYKEEWKEKADIIIADLPCSGLGVTGKKCDIKYKTKPGDIEELAALQRDILEIAGRYVKPGGRLIYSTCTVTQEENLENLKWITDKLPFINESIEEVLPECLKGKTGRDGYIQVLPSEDGTDGFFVASFIKKG